MGDAGEKGEKVAATAAARTAAPLSMAKTDCFWAHSELASELRWMRARFGTKISGHKSSLLDRSVTALARVSIVFVNVVAAPRYRLPPQTR